MSATTTPPLHSFPYDPFQQRAIEAIRRGASLFVAAPTGAGKTVIADYAIEQTLARGQRVIYTAPIKALSNQKFRDFSARYSRIGIIPPPGSPTHGGHSPANSGAVGPSGQSQVVGIMTGDVTLNPSAPLLIMTTEIYRNALLEASGRLSQCAWVIFDEIHYLDDPERGTVWEEAIMFTPPSINLLALSATVPNVEQLAEWIRAVHQRPVEVITETRRPVPLHMAFQCQNAILTSAQALKHQGYLNREDWSKLRPRPADRWSRGGHRARHRRDRLEDRWQTRPNRLDALARHLQQTGQLPSIFFTFGRRRTEELAWEAAGLPLVSPEERATLRAIFQELCARYQISHDHTAQAMAQLIERGVAYHHAGMLPTVKEVVERCFVSRLIKFIVTTETFALGVNMPARSVVIDTLKKRVNGRFDLLRSRQFLQMAGRAGRRGMDEAGFVYLRVNPATVTYHDVMRVLHNQPELVQSRFNTSYATLLNLYRRRGRGLLELFPKTLYYFQTSGARREAGLSLMQRKLALLTHLGYLTAQGLSARGEFASWLYGYELLLTELQTQHRLEALDAPSLAVLMAAIVYEPRPGLRLAKTTAIGRRLDKLCEEPLAKIHRAEHQFQIRPISKAPHFQLAAAAEAWFHGAAFSGLTKLCEVDEGEIVRYFRMAVQGLRQIIDTKVADASLHRKAELALARVNRDVVDAEQQLRLG